MTVITNNEKIKYLNSIFGDEILSRSGKNISVVCPACKKSESSLKKKKLSICLETGIYHCWVCETKGKNIVYLAKEFCSFKSAIDNLRKVFGDIKTKKTDIEDHDSVFLPEDFRLLCLNNGKSALAAKNYLKRRGVNSDTIVKYKIGTSNIYPYGNRIIFPSFDVNLQLNYFLARTYDKKEKITYKNCKNSKKNIIFNENLIDWKEPLVIVEGVFDAMKVEQNVTCMLGSWMDESFLLFQKIVKNKTPIILAPDPDAREKAQKIAKNLMSYCIDVKMTSNLDSDFGDMKEQEVENYLNNARRFDNTDRIRYLIGDIKSGSIY